MSMVPTPVRYLSYHTLGRRCVTTIMENWLERSTLSPDNICDLRLRDFGASFCAKAPRSSNLANLPGRHSGIRLHPFNMRWSTTLMATSSMMHGGEVYLAPVQTFHIQTQAVPLPSMATEVMAVST